MKRILVLSRTTYFISAVLRFFKGKDYKITTQLLSFLPLNEDAEVALDVAYSAKLSGVIADAKGYIIREREIAQRGYDFIIADIPFMEDMGESKFQRFKEFTKTRGVLEFFTVNESELDIVKDAIYKTYVPLYEGYTSNNSHYFG